MASYRSGFDPPPRSEQVDIRSKRLGTYIQPPTARQEDRGGEFQHLAGKVEQRMGYPQPQVERPGQTSLPRPSMRSTSPAARGDPSSSRRGTESSSGYGRAPSNTPIPAKPTTSLLAGKSSRNVLRRKQSSIGQHDATSRALPERSGSASPSKWPPISAENRPSIDASLKSAEAYNEIFLRTRTKVPITADIPRIIPELDRYRPNPNQNVPYGKADIPHKLSTTDLPPPTPQLSGTPLYSGSSSSHHRYSGYSGSGYSGSGYSVSPSTRFSESPGPGAFYSRNTTPTSTASQSPGLVAPLKPMTPRLKQGSPAHTRPPVTRRRATSNANETEGAIVDPHGLPSLRESSLTSSSSNSTVKGEKKPEMREKKKKGLSPLPPSPPPRKSSQKFKKPHSSPQESPSKPSQDPAELVMVSPVKPTLTRKNTTSPSQSKNVPPTRPSRDGAPDLQAQLGESMAVIQSNLAGLTFAQDKRSSGIQRNAPSPLLLPRPTQVSRLPARNPSPSPVQASPRLGTPAPAGLGIIPDLKPRQPPTSTVTGLRTPSPSTVTSRPRFGLFGRRTKTAPEVMTVEAIREKAARKGPTAGTGHEGYGRYAIRGRSTSAGGLVRGRERERSTSVASSSQESISSTRTHDPFLLERMSPVIIAGGEVIENRNTSAEITRTESNTSVLQGRPSVESSKGSSKSGVSHEASRTTLWPSALPKEPAKRSSTLPAPKMRRPSDSSDDGFGKGSTTFRRSIQRMNNSSSALHVPKPLDAGASMTSLDASILSEDSLEVAGVGRGRKGQIQKSKKLEKQRPRSPRKWNIFHRSTPKPESKPDAAVSVTVGRQPVKPIPHYALLDSSDEMPDYLEGVDLEDILRDAEVVDLSNEELDLLQFGEMTENLKREKETKLKAAKAEEQRLPPLLFSSPEPLQMMPEPSPAEMHLGGEESQPRPSRLPQVGRIPKVISARPQATSPKSFSRPFARLSMIQPVQEPVILDAQSVALGASPPKSSLPEPPRTNLQEDINAGLRRPSADSGLERTNTDRFLQFSPRTGSEATTSSNSTSLAGLNVVIPDSFAEVVDDEVWDEYDDLIENEDGGKVPVSATSSHGVPFQYESYESRRIRKSNMNLKESPTLATFAKIPEPAEGSSQPRKSLLTSSSIYSADMDPRLKDSLAAIPTPTTPMSFTEFFSGYGDRNNSVHADSARKPLRLSQSSSRKSTSSSSHSRSLSGLMTINEQENTTPISEVNLRVGSMTVSKWLTFGHVLFSPARDSMGQSKRHSVLVIDGLGNDDWSFYAAETYPSATFYNLSPTRPLSSSHRLSAAALAFPLTPPNHRQIEHASPNLKFPFPSSTFHVVVFRFPPSLPPGTYQHIISEAKRVLLPGGYLELAILDLDMNSMGPRARRAVRGLKMRMQSSEEGFWTGSASDTVLKLIGKRGFDSVKSCCVGVPVATSIPSSSSVSATAKTQTQSSTSASTSTTTSVAMYQEEKSLADLMKDPSRESDEGITKMVARVGRWWYTRCYEGGTSNEEAGIQSIFDDEAMVRESEEWNASFKLLVAHARKPVVARRRTLSA